MLQPVTGRRLKGKKLVEPEAMACDVMKSQRGGEQEDDGEQHRRGSTVRLPLQKRVTPAKGSRFLAHTAAGTGAAAAALAGSAFFPYVRARGTTRLVSTAA